MLGPFEVKSLSVWDFALAFYQMPNVESDCLMAQDRFGLDVTALIFALHRAKNGDGFDAGLVAELARTVSARVVEPLRAARIALKSMPNLVDTTESEALRQRVKAGELDAERLTLNALANLPIAGEALSCEASLLAIAAANQAAEHPDLTLLLKRLACAAQNM